MFLICYKHPKSKISLKYDFVKYHGPCSVYDRKETGDEGPNGDKLELKQVPEGWKWVIVQFVR